MDENNLEITATVEPMGVSTNQYAAIGAGFGVGIIAGALLYRFVITPAIKKYNEKKAAKNAKPVNDDPKDEEKS